MWKHESLCVYEGLSMELTNRKFYERQDIY